MTTLTFSKCRYTVKVSPTGKPATPIDKIKGGLIDRDLLIDVSGEVSSGHVLSVMGPSGAGKTTLLNMLTLEKKGGSPYGHIQINGKPLTIQKYNEACAYVQQFDSLWSALNARDHLNYALMLYQPALDTATRASGVDKLIKDVGLEDSATTRAGDEFLRGLSGGNKRRLSIAVALAKNPSVLFLDEPTSGVDSASAVRMMSFLNEIAKSSQICAVCTIHQPPASVFAGFDNTLILSMGRVAYFGSAAKMGEYFTSVGSAPPPDTNMAEFVLDLVNKDFTPIAGVRTLLDAWAKRNGEGYGMDSASARADKVVLPVTTAGFCKQVAVLTNRTVVLAYRQPLSYLLRMCANFFLNVFFGVIYVKTRERTQDQVQSKTFFLMFGIGIPMQFILVSVYLYYNQWLSLKREVKDGMYHPAADAIASWIVQLPMMFVLAVCSLVPVFVIGDLYWPNFGLALVIYAFTFWSFEGLGQMLAVGPNVILGLFNFLNIFFAAFLFCGMFVDPADVVWPLRIFCYVMPLGWALQSYMYAIFHGQQEYEGTVDCVPGTPTPIGGFCNDQGFYCPDPAVCYGKTGDQQLNSLGLQFTIFGDEGHIARNLGFIIAFGAVCRLGYMATITYLTKVSGGQEPTEPLEAMAAAPAIVEKPTAAPAATPAVAVAVDETASVARGKSVFAFSEVSYVITPKRMPWQAEEPPKTVLSDAAAEVHDGEILAIVGPSGAGKTILLNTLTFTKGPGTPMGKVTINGQQLNTSTYAKSCIYVPREDNLWPTLTARQHLTFAYKTFRPELGTAAQSKAIDDMLAATGMTSAQHTKAGGLLVQGLSGGQRRRLSLAIALVKEPRVILLDEPTSGLDSAAAAAIITLLKTIAKTARAAIVCTIHQPSAAVFGGFDSVLVLAEGRAAYSGPTKKMAAHFETIGKPLSKDANPAEAVLDMVSKDITSKEAVTTVLDAWTKVAAAAPKSELSAEALEFNLKDPGCSTIMYVFQRQGYLALTDPLQFILRLCVAPFLTCFFGLVYRESAQNVQVQVPFRLFFLWWILAVPAVLPIINILVYNFEMRTVIMEMKNRMYGPFSYAMATTVVQVPMLLLLSFAINVFAFLIGGWPWDNFVTYNLMYACNLLVFESMAQLLAVAFKNPILGMLLFLMTWSSAIVFCGLVFRGGDVIWPFRLFYYIMPLRWLFNGCGWDIYTPAIFSGATNCVAGDPIVSSAGNGTCPPSMDPSVGSFFCYDASSSLGCFGREGNQVLATLHMTYESLGPDDERVMDVLILIGMAVVCKLSYMGALWVAVKTSDSPRMVGDTVVANAVVPNAAAVA